MRRAIVAGILALLSISACGAPPENPSLKAAQATPDPLATESPVPPPEVNWSNPIEGIEVPGFAAAQNLLPFEVYRPKNLGTPFKVLVTAPERTTLRQMVLASLYETAEYGLVAIKQHYPDVPLEEWDKTNLELVAMNADPATHGRFDIVPVRDGARALMTTSDDGAHSALYFLNGTIEIIIRGPRLDAIDVVEIANKI